MKLKQTYNLPILVMVLFAILLTASVCTTREPIKKEEPSTQMEASLCEPDIGGESLDETLYLFI